MSVNNSTVVKNKKYELVAPDGGWGYMIFISAILNFTTTTMLGGCFGLVFNEFMDEIGLTSTYTTLLTGTNAMCLAISGFLTSPLLKVMTMRQLGFLAAVIFNLGMLGTVFVKSIPLFFLCQGIMQGIGIGILYNLTCTILNDYFVTKRLFAVSFVQTISALTSMVMPMFIKWCLNKYDYRGTLLILTGLTLQNLIAVALMQPVQWHMKKVEIPEESEMQPMLVHDDKNKSDVSTVKLTDTEAAVSISEKVNEITVPEPKKSTGLRMILDSVIDIKGCKSILLSCVCIGVSVCVFAEMTYSLILPQALYSMGWTQDNVALAISLTGFGDLAARTVLIFTSKWLHYVGSQEIYVMGLVVAILARLGMLWSVDVTVLLIYITLMGVGRCTICVLIPMVISDAVSPDQFTSAMGIMQLLSGIVNLCLGPAIGAVRDLTHSYSVAFYILTSCMAITVIFWSIELCYKKNKHKRIERNGSGKSSQ